MADLRKSCSTPHRSRSRNPFPPPQKKTEVKRNILANLRGLPTASFLWNPKPKSGGGQGGLIRLADLVLDLVMEPLYPREFTLENKREIGRWWGYSDKHPRQ